MVEKAHIYVCCTCGSKDVSQDAWADWNPASEQMELRSSFDDSFCHACESSCKAEEQEITDPKELQRIANEREQLRITRHADEMFHLLGSSLSDWSQWDEDTPINGGDMVDWYCQYRGKVEELLDKINPPKPPAKKPDLIVCHIATSSGARFSTHADEEGLRQDLISYFNEVHVDSYEKEALLEDASLDAVIEAIEEIESVSWEGLYLPGLGATDA